MDRNNRYERGNSSRYDDSFNVNDDFDGRSMDGDDMERQNGNDKTNSGTGKTWYNKTGDFMKNNGVIFLIVISILLIVIATLWMIAIFRGSAFTKVDIVSNVIRLDKPDTLPLTVPGSKLPTSTSQNYTYSYWIYLSDYDTLYNDRVLFRRGGYAESLLYSNPIVAMDSNTNRMYIALKTNMSVSAGTMEEVLDRNNRYSVATIEYVPLQRWVHIAFTVQDAVVTVFVDGDIYSVSNITDSPGIDSTKTFGTISSFNTSNTSSNASNASNPLNQRPIFSTSVGDVLIGNNSSMTKGFLSKMQYINMALTQKEIALIYKQGPVQQSFLSFLGINMYGFRSPVYKLDTDV